MNTKLTLRMDERLIRNAKRHAARSGRSISQLVADFFAAIASDGASAKITPRVRSLRGSLAGTTLDERDYRRHLEARHR